MKLFTTCVLAALAAAPAGGAQEFPVRYRAMYDTLRALSPDPAQTAAVSALDIRRDAGIFTLVSGTLSLCRPVGGRVVGAVFTGKGIFRFTPPTEVEQEQLYRFYEQRALEEEFAGLFLMFADSTAEELRRRVAFGPSEGGDPDEGPVREAMSYLADDDSKEFDASLMTAFLEDARSDLFFACVRGGKNSPLFFMIDPTEMEDVQLLRRWQGAHWEHYQERVCSFTRGGGGGAPAGDMRQDAKDRFAVTAYRVDCTINDDLEISAVADMRIVPRQSGRGVQVLRLYGRLAVDSVFWNGSARLPFYRGNESWALWLEPPEALVEGQACSLRVHYHGEFLRKDELGWIHLASSLGWYPRYGFRGYATYDLTFHAPKQYVLVSVGEPVGTTVSGDVVTTRWVTDWPAWLASFNLGYFKTFGIDEKGIPPVSVFMSKSGHAEISQAAARAGIATGSDMEEEVASDIRNSLAFFQTLYGPPVAKRMTASEIPGSHGAAFPGFLHLSWATFQLSGSRWESALFRSHEVAHQWWGIGVDFKSYHDQWLSEGFSEYSALSFVLAAEKKGDTFFKVLRKWRDEILSNRKFIFGSGQEAGPVWLGGRTSSSSTPGDYDLIIYKKGAWVLHMLRNMLLDLQTMNEDRFKRVMKSFYTANVGKQASTADFQRVVEKDMGISMEWFFRQWIYGTAIPKYQFAYRTEEAEGGKIRMSCKIRQLGVPDGFQMPVPMRVDFGEKRYARTRAIVNRPVVAFELMLPMEPKDVILNDMESVLCEVESVSWEEASAW